MWKTSKEIEGELTKKEDEISPIESDIELEFTSQAIEVEREPEAEVDSTSRKQ